MDPTFHLKMAQERRLAMTFALRQALEILQMPQAELCQWLTEEIEKNPLLKETCPPKSFEFKEEIPSQVSLYDHLQQQIKESFASLEHQKIAEEFLAHLDEKGYLSISLEELARRLQKPLSSIEMIYLTLQTFDPPGIFARNLQEALLFQLKAQGSEEAPIFSLIRDYFEDLVHGRYAAIKKKMGPIDLSEAIRKLSRLAFRPNESFKNEPLPIVFPDLKIQKTGPNWTIEVNEEYIPKIHIDSEYESIEPKSSEEKESLRLWASSAKWLMRSLKRRRQTLIEIGTFLVKKQAAYLSQKGDLKPLSLQDLAIQFQLHESTLSRALHGKYAETPRGLIPLRSLLSSSPETQKAKDALQKLILSEDKKKPLTDDQISALLESKGFRIARRTIVKYRKELKIGAASSRKHLS